MKKSFALGYYHIAVWCIIWATMNVVNASGANIYRNALCETYAVSAAPLLDAATYGGWCGALLFLVVPKLVGHFGAKKVMLWSLIAGGFAFALIPQTPALLVMQVGIVLTGLFAGVYGITTPMIMVSRWFPRRKGQVMGIVSSGVIFSTVVIIPIFNRMIASYDIKPAMSAIGAFLMAFGVVNLFILKDSPEECGLLPDNREMSLEEQARFFVRQEPRLTLQKALQTRRLWTMSFGWGLILMALIGFLFIGVSYMLERGVPQQTAMGALAASGILGCLGSLLMGRVDQQIGPVKTSLISYCMMTLGFCIVIFYRGSSVVLTVAGFLLVQTFMGSVNSLGSSHNLSVFSGRDFPITSNIQGAVTSIVKMFGTFIAARSFALTGNYELAYRSFGIALTAGILLIVLTGDQPYAPGKNTENSAYAE